MTFGDRILERVQALADPTRLQICVLLAAEELCVCHFEAELGISQALASHHVNVLRRAGLVESRRHSYWTYYRLNAKVLAELTDELSELTAKARRPATARACDVSTKPVAVRRPRHRAKARHAAAARA